MRAKLFFKGLSWLLVLNLLIKPLWIFGIDRQVQNLVGQEAYGTYFSLFNLTYVLLFLADAGLSNMVAQRMAIEEKLNAAQLFRWKMLLLLLYAGGCVAVAVLTGVRQWNVLLLLVLIQSLTSFFLFLRSLLAARQLFSADALFSILDKTLLLVLCIGPVYGFFAPMTITLFLRLQVLSTAFAVGSLSFVLMKKAAFAPGEHIAPKKLFRWTTPFVLLILLMSAHNRLDAFLLERLHPDGARQAGIYAMAYRLLDAGNMVGYLTASFLVPFLARNQNNKPLVQQVLLLSRHGLLLLSAGVVAFALFFAPWIQAVLYHSTNENSNAVMRLCLLSLPAYYLTHVYGSALTATANLRPFIGLVFSAVVANVLLNLWLIPNYGATGCCMAALASQYGLGFALWLTASRRLHIDRSTRTAVLYAATAILLCLLFYSGQKLTGNVWIILSSIVLLALLLVATQRSRMKKYILPLYK